MTVCTTDSLPNWKSSRSPGAAAQAALMAARSSAVMVLAKGDWVHSPPSPTLARASPLEPIPLTYSSSLSISVRERLAEAGTFMALTIPFPSTTSLSSGTPPPPCSRTRPVRTTCSMPKRRSGLSLPYLSIDS